ncbi:hypothetical protein ACOTEK_16400 [Achromobacter xylosoxidans]
MKTEIKNYWICFFPILVFAILGLKDLMLPGIYMDAANPDYHAAYMMRGDVPAPAWTYRDNYLFMNFPLLNSLYGGNFIAYPAMAFFSALGYGIPQFRMYHVLIGIVLLVCLMWCLRKWQVPKVVVAITACVLAVDPTFLFAWRTQYYLQLVPLIFFFLALGLLAQWHSDATAGPRSNARYWWAGILLGFAAFCYFVFAFYAVAIILVFVFQIRHSLNRGMIAAVVLGTLIGWLPFIYAHLSIVLNIGFHDYLSQLRGLQTTYGVGNVAQSWSDRWHAVIERLLYLRSGSSVEDMIFAGARTSPAARIIGGIVLVTGPVLWLCFRLWPSWSIKEVDAAAVSKGRMLGGAFLGVFSSHLLFGAVVGKPLGLQHYIMLLPLAYAMLGLAWSIVLLSTSKGGERSGDMRGAVKAAFIFVCVGMLAFNLSISRRIGERLLHEGGAGMYAEAINVAITQLATEPRDTALLFPQWGYWMGALTAIGPRLAMFETSSLDKMKDRLGSDPELLQRQSFVLVLGGAELDPSDEISREKVVRFAETVHLRVENIAPCHGRSGQDRIWLVKMKRLSAQ